MMVSEAVALTPAELAEAQALTLRQPDPDPAKAAAAKDRAVQDVLFQKQQRAFWPPTLNPSKRRFPSPSAANCSDRRSTSFQYPLLHPPVNNQHRIAIAIESVPLLHRLFIGLSQKFESRRRRTPASATWFAAR